MPERKKTVSAVILTACCLLLAAAAVSCSTIGLSEDKKGKEVLKASVEAFNTSFRWEDYNSAALWIPSGRKEQFWKDVDTFKRKIKIIEFQIRELDHIEKSDTATAILNFQYYRTDCPTLQNVTITQNWYFSEKDKAWQLGQSGYQAMTKISPGM